MRSKALRILLLTGKHLIPPDHATSEERKTAEWRTEFDVLHTLRQMGHEVQVLGVEGELTPIRKAVEEWQPQVSFNMLEDFDGVAVFEQNLVSYLELLNIPYTGCNPRGLMLSRDKALSKKIMAFHGIPTPDFTVFPKNSKVKRPKNLRFPLFVKSLIEEASLGISQSSIVYDDRKLEERVQFIHDSVHTDAIAESYIEGRELYVGVIGNHAATPLPVWELEFKSAPEQVSRIATRRAKWNESYRRKYGIASRKADNISPQLEKKILSRCKHIYQTLHLSGYARMDFRLSPNGEIYLIEANPNPHIGRHEDFAQSALAADVTYPDLLQKILNFGLRWKSRDIG